MPPLQVVCGDCEYLRLRYAEALRSSAVEAGWATHEVSEGEVERLRNILRGGFFEERRVVFVAGASVKTSSKKSSGVWPSELVDELVAHAAVTVGVQCSVVVVQGTGLTSGSLGGELVARIPKLPKKEFAAPKPWAAVEFSTNFLEEELRAHGITYPPALPGQVVSRVGTDLGVLVYEAMKIGALAAYLGRTSVVQSDVLPVLSGHGEVDVEAVKGAVVRRDAVAASRLIQSAQLRGAGESPARIVAVLAASVQRWLHASVLSASRVPDEEAAAAVGVHPYIYRKDVLPVVASWSRSELLDLLEVTSEAHPRRGRINPWVYLESSLIRILRRPGKG